MQKEPCDQLLMAKLDYLPNQLALALIHSWRSVGHGAAQPRAGGDTPSPPFHHISWVCSTKVGNSHNPRGMWANALAQRLQSPAPVLIG